MRRLGLVLMTAIVVATCSAHRWTWPASVELTHGELSVSFTDNSDGLSGLRKTSHASAPDVQAFRSGGLNYEHVISSATDKRNGFTPRKGPLELRAYRHEVSLHRRQADSPWQVPAIVSYKLVPPHFVDFTFEATITDASQFKSGEVTFFFASYMAEPQDYEIKFRGIPSKDAAEQWVSSAPNGTPATIYAAKGAPDLARDPTDPWHQRHLTQEPFPRITQPFYYGRAAAGMLYAVLFDRLVSEDDEVRFAVFRWHEKKPAWDFEYVARNLSDGKKVGFKGRMVWKPFVSEEEVLQIFRDWKPR